MPKSLAFNYIHLMFSTKYRELTIISEIKASLYQYIAGICKILIARHYRQEECPTTSIFY